MRIYLDMCCYNRPYDDQSQLKVMMEAQSKLYIQMLVKQGSLELTGSYILDYECGNNPFEMRRNAIEEFVAEHMTHYVGAERAEVLKAKAEEIMGTGVKEMDAYHVASAILARCDYFITTDKRLLKYPTDEVRIVTPITFITETEDDPV